MLIISRSAAGAVFRNSKKNDKLMVSRVTVRI